jgi:hypothetical protein
LQQAEREARLSEGRLQDDQPAMPASDQTETAGAAPSSEATPATAGDE